MMPIQKNRFIMTPTNQRKLGRTIRILKNSIELSSKETCAKSLEKSYKKNINTNYGIEVYPVKSLKNIDIKKIKERP